MSRAAPPPVVRMQAPSTGNLAPGMPPPRASRGPYETLLATMMHRSAPRELLHKTSFRLATRALEAAVLCCAALLGTALALLHARHLRGEGCARLVEGAAEGVGGIVEMAVGEGEGVFFSFSRERGVLLLSEGARKALGVSVRRVVLKADDECLGGSLVKAGLKAGLGYEEVAANAFLTASGRRGVDRGRDRGWGWGGDGDDPGFVRGYPSRRLINLSHAAAAGGGGARRVARLGALVTALFIMCTTGALVAFTLKEVQVRIVKLTHDLQYAMRAPGAPGGVGRGGALPGRRRDIGGMGGGVNPAVGSGGGGGELDVGNGGEYMAVLLRYALDALVFVPIVAGVLFFLFEFFDDQVLAFAVLVVAWLAEIAVSGSTRHWVSRQYLPRLFFVYFGAFHFYFFSFPLGFTWLAFATCVALMFHACLAVWNRFELPLMQQQADARWEWR